MACIVSISFVAHPPASLTLSKGRRQYEFPLGRLSSLATITAAQNVVLGSCSSNKGMLSMNQSCQDHLLARPRILCETFSAHNLIEDYCTSIVISGYWVGPDVDDGWGFVEAFVNQMT